MSRALAELAAAWSEAVDAGRPEDADAVSGELVAALERAGALDVRHAVAVGPWAYWAQPCGGGRAVARRCTT